MFSKCASFEQNGTGYAWGYNEANRLVSETYTENSVQQYATSFVYDEVGNRREVTTNGQTTVYDYNERDQLTLMTRPDFSEVEYDYDDRGNLEQITDGTDITLYQYNARNLLTQATLPDSTIVAYTYDHEGRRTSQSDGTDTTKYVWDRASMYGDVVLETDGTGSPLASYVLAGNQILSQERASTTHYFLPDAQGSVRNLTDATGTVTDTYRYTAYGELYAQNGPTTNNYLYTGQQYDSLTGLYSLRARYYDPAMGRFLTRDTWPLDTFNPVELNRYQYGVSNPVRFSDPSGYGDLALQYVALSQILFALFVILTVGIIIPVAYFAGPAAFDYITELIDGAVEEAEEQAKHAVDTVDKFAGNVEKNAKKVSEKFCEVIDCDEVGSKVAIILAKIIIGLVIIKTIIKIITDLLPSPAPAPKGRPSGGDDGDTTEDCNQNPTAEGCQQPTTTPGPTSTPAPTRTPPPSATPSSTPTCPTIMRGDIYPNIPTISLDNLTHCRPEVAATFALILSNGPFPYPGKDNTRFRNDGGVLPPISTPPDQYREYTVDTPGSPNRAMRRIVTGGSQTRAANQFDLGQVYYTDEHYRHFFRIVLVGN